MVRFLEPCYWGEPAGKEVEFSKIETDDPYLYVASLYNVWKDKNTKEITTTMTLLMRPASAPVMEAGHHRQPFFIHKEGIDRWLARDEREPIKSKQILKQYAAEPELSYSVIRNMADAWKKRQKDRVAKRDEQLSAIAENGPLGI